MEITKTIYVTDRKDWREWLEKNYKTKTEIWLIYYKKDSGKPRIPYNDCVEEALCFGWIDSTVKGIDKEKYAQRFSPRNLKTPYSQSNKERLKRLIKEKKIIKEVLATLGDLSDEKYEIPKDILEKIKGNKEAWKNFKNFSEGYKRIRISFIEASRNRPEEFSKRLNHFINMTEKNKQFGFGGIQKYYE